MKSKATTTNAVDILYQRFIAGRPEMIELLDQEINRSRIAEAVYSLRGRLGISQKSLASRSGLAVSIIRDLEDACYTGDAAAALRKIAEACDQTLVFEIQFLPAKAAKAQQPRLREKATTGK